MVSEIEKQLREEIEKRVRGNQAIWDKAKSFPHPCAEDTPIGEDNHIHTAIKKVAKGMIAAVGEQGAVPHAQKMELVGLERLVLDAIPERGDVVGRTKSYFTGIV
jgi:hypothetical protein